MTGPIEFSLEPVYGSTRLCRSLLLYLQLIMQITENMPDALGDQTEKVLIFIEQALRSSTAEGESIAVDDEAVDSDDEDGEGAGDVDAGLDGDLDDQDVGKLGLMETAIHLLLATLQCKHTLLSNTSTLR